MVAAQYTVHDLTQLIQKYVPEARWKDFAMELRRIEGNKSFVETAAYVAINLEMYTNYVQACHEQGESPCVDIEHHKWAISDDDDNVCYCEKCGCPEY